LWHRNRASKVNDDLFTLCAMSSNKQKGFRLGPWLVEPMRGSITGPAGDVAHLEPKVMEVLLQLVGSPNQLVRRDELLDAVWSNQVALQG
jgi:DNA-binding winged helix-turn-helix (wHTH) protein